MGEDDRNLIPSIMRWQVVLVAALSVMATVAAVHLLPTLCVGKGARPPQSQKTVEAPAPKADAPTAAAGPVYEARAVLRLVDNASVGSASLPSRNAQLEAEDVRVRMLAWNSIRNVILGERVDFGVPIDPDNRRDIEKLHHFIATHARVEPKGAEHILVSFRSSRPEMNAYLVNELVKRFVGGERREEQDEAKVSVRYHSDRLKTARLYQKDAEDRLRALERNHPWICDEPVAVYKAFEESRERMGELELEIDLLGSEEEDADVKKRLRTLGVAFAREKMKLDGLRRRVDIAPKQWAERDALRLELASLIQTVDACAKRARVADDRLRELLNEAFSSRYRVTEYARDSRIPIEGAPPVILPDIEGKQASPFPRDTTSGR